MAAWVLIDTSAWIDFFRVNPSRKARSVSKSVSDKVDRLLADGTATLCGPIETELRRGLRAPERKSVLPFFSGCRFLDQPESLWRDAGDLGAHLRDRGAAVKTLDLLIATYAIAYDIPILTRDKDFLSMVKAGIPLMLYQ